MSACAEGVRWGVDDAGSNIHLPKHPKADQLLEEFGFDLWVVHYFPNPSIEVNLSYIRSVDAWCAERGVDWVTNVEGPNFVKEHIDEKGRSWYNRPDGRHYHLFPEEVLEELGRCERLRGIMYDEAAHMQNCRNKIAGLDQPWIFDPEGHSLESAAEGFTAAVKEIADLHAEHELPLFTEHVFPVLFHGFARAGWTAATKVLKENWSPAYVACAMGAALQYDTELWITPDLWGMPGYPGHSVDEYRSALLLAYHMGADCIYTENLAYNSPDNPVGSLVRMTEDDYEVTEYGEVTKWFRREYMPTHPRAYSFRDVKPRVAIIRQPDACWGQSESWLPNWLFGCKEWPSNPTTEAWLRLWHLLSRGVISEHSLSWHNAQQQKAPYQVFCPLDGVVVFDHHVGAERLQGVEVIFLTGLGITDAALAAVETRVSEGATCVSLPHLLPRRVAEQTGESGTLEDGAGLWVATPDFLAEHVRKHIEHVLPDEDSLRYRFGAQTVTFRPIDGDPNRLSVGLE